MLKLIPSPIYPAWLFNIAMENGPFTDGFTVLNSMVDLSMAMLNSQMVY